MTRAEKVVGLFGPLGMQESLHDLQDDEIVETAIKACYVSYQMFCGETEEFQNFRSKVLNDLDGSLGEQLIYMFVRHYALFKWLESSGLCLDVVLGHSNGEFMAAVAAGVMELSDAMRQLVARSEGLKQLKQFAETGRMVSLKASEAETKQAIREFETEGTIVIAAINSPEDTVISGPDETVTRFCRDTKFKSKKLDVPAAMHSAMVASVKDRVDEAAKKCILRSPSRFRMVSSLTGTEVTEEVTMASHWSAHDDVRPINFLKAMYCLKDLGCWKFVEFGFSGKLLGLGQRCLCDEALVWQTAKEAMDTLRCVTPSDVVLTDREILFSRMDEIIATVSAESVSLADPKNLNKTLINLGFDSTSLGHLAHKMRRKGIQCSMILGRILDPSLPKKESLVVVDI